MLIEEQLIRFKKKQTAKEIFESEIFIKKQERQRRASEISRKNQERNVSVEKDRLINDLHDTDFNDEKQRERQLNKIQAKVKQVICAKNPREIAQEILQFHDDSLITFFNLIK